MRRSLVFLSVSATTLLLATQMAGAAANLRIDAPDTYVAIPPGAFADVALTLNNVGDQASAPDQVLLGKTADYVFEQRSLPECGPIQTDEDESSDQFAVPAIAVGAVLTCTIRITRVPGAIDSAYIDIALASDFFGSAKNLFVGTFADIALSSELVSREVDTEGIVHGVFRLVARNIGNVPVDEFNAMTCSDPNTIENDLPGGCAPTSSLCARPLIPFAAKGALLPALAPGEQTSCLLRLSAPTPAAAATTLVIEEDHAWDIYLIDTNTQGRVFDSAQDNNATTLNLASGSAGQPLAIAAPTLDLPLLALLGTGLLAIAALALMRSRRT